MSKKNEIVHTGKIVDINPDFTTVEIMVSSACSECHAKGICGVSEMEEKVIMVPTDPYELRQVGDVVQVKTKMTMGFKAIWISYVIPLVILMILVLSLSIVVENEFLRGGIAIAGVGLYYLVIWLLRGKLANQFEFYL
jgi:sigma-E factor negative regulatory protein RseC